MKFDAETVFWNVMLYVYSVLGAFFVIQHAVFIYGTIDRARMLDEPWHWYFIVGFLVWFGFKLAHFASERGEVEPEEDEVMSCQSP